MKRFLAKVWFPVFCIILFAFLLWLGMTNRNLYLELKADGKEPVTIASPFTPVNGRDGANGINGRNGVDGTDGQDGAKGDTGLQGIQGLTGLQGLKGDTGAAGVPGTPGVNGTDGRTPELACVIRWDVNLPTVTRYFLAWKYQQEPNTAYKDLYKLPAWAECMSPVDLTM